MNSEMSGIEIIPLSVSDKRATIKCENRNEMFNKMKLFYEDQRFCDVDLIASVDNFRIAAHRIILSAASEYFLDILQNPEVTELIIADVNSEILKLLLNYIYTATIEISSETVFDIMRASIFLKLNTVEAECSLFISRSLDKSNCLPLAVSCRRNSYNELFEKASMYAAQHFGQLIEEQEYLQLEVEDLTLLLMRNDLYAMSEEEVFHGIVRWITHDKPGRECHCLKLLSHLRFPLLTPEFIVNEVADKFTAPEQQAVIMKALKWHMSPSSRTSIFEEALCKPRNQVDEVILIKRGTQEDDPLIAEVLDPITGIWNSLEWPVNAQSGWYTNGIHMQGSVYFSFIAFRNGTDQNCVLCFNLKTKQWSELPPMIKRRFSFGMVELNGHLYAVGGQNGTKNLYSVEKWDPNSPQKWQNVAPMLHERNGPGVTTFNGLLYAFGSSSNFDHRTFEFYDPQTNTWAPLNPPTMARIAAGVCVNKGLLYAVGGWTANGCSTIVERYNFESDSWTELSPSGMFQQYFQCISWNNRLLVLVDMKEGEFKHIEEYNPETGKWRTFRSCGKKHATAILISKRTSS